MHMLVTIKLDEREKLHEALAERNVSWFTNAVLLVGISYQSIVSVISHTFSVDIFLIVALIGATIVKGFSYFYLLDK